MRTGTFLTGVLRGAFDLQSPEGVIEASSKPKKPDEDVPYRSLNFFRLLDQPPLVKVVPPEGREHGCYNRGFRGFWA